MIRSALPVLLGVILASCGDLSVGVGGPGPSASQALELALAVQDELESATAALTVARPGPPPAWTPPAGCPAVQGTADADGDGIPDDATLTYAAPPCQVPFRRGSLQVTGELGIVDPNFANNQGFNLTYTDLAWAYVDSTGDRDYTATRNGTRARLGSSDASSLTSSVTIVRQRPNRANTTLTLDLVHSFTAATPGTLLVGQPAPSGGFTISGTVDWQRSTEDWQLTVATPTPLVYDATCTATPRISSGRVTLTGMINGHAGTLWLTWSACGVEPTRAWAGV